jgi:aconitate hydratase
VVKKDYAQTLAVDDLFVIPPASPAEAEATEIIRGPNIKPCPVAPVLTPEISVKVLIKTEDNITTDHIMPAGTKILPLRSNIPEISKHVFAALDPEFYNKARAAQSGIIVGGENYGQGSSREHAAIAPMYLGVRAVLVKSFARIHKANLINFGILPLTFADPTDFDHINEGDELELTDIIDSLEGGVPVVVVNKTRNLRINTVYELGRRDIEILKAGGMLNHIKSQVAS